uniref:Uncharacterized protein n=1 Tax=Calidris pygmaea TaxID=425635 RepID=A0A8C3J639_9CHAR
MSEELLLEGDFGGPPGAGGGPRFHLRLTRTELQILGGGGTGTATPPLCLADVVGCHTLRAPSLPAAAFFAVYAYPPRCRGGPGGPRRRRRAPTFRVDAAPHYEGNRATAERWARTIRCLVRGLPLPPPAGKGGMGGRGGAKKVAAGGMGGPQEFGEPSRAEEGTWASGIPLGMGRGMGRGCGILGTPPGIGRGPRRPGAPPELGGAVGIWGPPQEWGGDLGFRDPPPGMERG